MKSSWLRHTVLRPHISLVVLTLSAALAACSSGGGSPGSGGSGSSIAVAVDPTSAEVQAGATKDFSATVSNTSDTSVTWRVNSVAGGDATYGTITAQGVYSAPDTMPADPRVSISAVSVANPAKSGAASVTITASPPSTPTSLASGSVTGTSVTLSWSAATDPGGPGLAGYLVYRNGTQIASVTGTSYTDSGLAAGTSYSYQVASFDKATPPHLSDLSTALNVRTLGGGSSSGPSSSSGSSSGSGSGSSSGSSSGSHSSSSSGTSSSSGGSSSSSSSSGAVPIAYVQSAYNDPAAATTTSATFGSAQMAGDLNVVVIGWSDGVSQVTAISDTAGNTYNLAVGPTNNAGYATQSIYYASNIAAAQAGTNTVSVTFNNNVNFPDLRVIEYAGISGANPLDVTAAAVGTGTNIDSGPANTTNANDLLVGADYIGAAFAAVGPGYTQRIVTNPDSDLVEDQIVTTTGSYDATSTQTPSSTWVMQLAAFRAGPSGSSSSSSSSGGSSTSSSGASSGGSSSGGSSGTSSSSSGSGTSSSSSSGGGSSGSGPTTISPRQAALTLHQTQQFTTNGSGLTWSVDGVVGGNSSVGTISASGVYTPPLSAGTHTVKGAYNGVSVTAPVAVTDLSGVFTYHNDLARTGQNLKEYALTPSSVSGGNFGKLWSCNVDGLVSASPLYVANVSIGGGTHNIVIVATMHDSVYAFDADNGSCTPYWQTSFLSSGVTTETATTVCGDVTTGEYGVTGTPVIDPSTNRLYLVAVTAESGTWRQRLHALNLSSGADATPPQVISASQPGNGDGGANVVFSAEYENQRSGLVLYNGVVSVAWGGHCDNTAWPWHGWVMGFDASTLAPTGQYLATPNGLEGGVWMSAGAPAVDSSGNMFFSTGNGTFDNTSDSMPLMAPNNDLGESFLNLSATTMALQDFYTPSANSAWSAADLDISAGGILVLPDGTGPGGHPNLVMGTDKQAHVWMMDRSNMSGYVPNQDNTVQYLRLPNAKTYSIHASPAYWNGYIYCLVDNGPLLALQLTGGLFAEGPPPSGSTIPVAIPSSQSLEQYNYPTPTPSISSTPSYNNGILWVIDNWATNTDNGAGPVGPAILRAYDATNLGTTLYSSSTLAADTAGPASKFISPTIANGHVYVVGNGTLTVYGLHP